MNKQSSKQLNMNVLKSIIHLTNKSNSISMKKLSLFLQNDTKKRIQRKTQYQKR